MVYVSSLVNWGEVYDKFRAVPGVYFFLSLLVVLIQTVALGWRWQRIGLIDDIRIRVSSHVTATLISLFFSQGLPAFIGSDTFRIWWYSRHGIFPARGLKIITFDRVIGVVSLAAVCALGVAVMLSTGSDHVILWPLVLGVGAAILGFCSLVLPFRTGLTEYLARLSRRLPNTPGKVLGWVIETREFFRAGSAAGVMLILATGVVIHLFTVLLGYVLALGLGSTASYMDCLVAIAPVLLISYIPISIAGWGVREVSLVFTFSMVGVDKETALLVSLGIGTTMLVVSLVGGALWMISDMRRPENKKLHQ